jgi:hypothetical protein
MSQETIIMHTHWAGRGLVSALVAIASVAGVPAVADASERPTGPSVPPGSVCSPFVDRPVADLGLVAPVVDLGGVLLVVADQSTGSIVNQEVSLYRGTEWEGTVGWNGPPGPSKWVAFGMHDLGLHTVNLTVTDECGRHDSASQDVWVRDLHIGLQTFP